MTHYEYIFWPSAKKAYFQSVDSEMILMWADKDSIINSRGKNYIIINQEILFLDIYSFIIISVFSVTNRNVTEKKY